MTDRELYESIDKKMDYPEEFNKWYYKQKMPMMDTMLQMVPIKQAAYIGWKKE